MDTNAAWCFWSWDNKVAMFCALWQSPSILFLVMKLRRKFGIGTRETPRDTLAHAGVLEQPWHWDCMACAETVKSV